MKSNDGETKTEETAVTIGDEVQFTDGPFSKGLVPVKGTVLRVDRRSISYPYTVQVREGQRMLQIPCASWEFTKI